MGIVYSNRLDYRVRTNHEHLRCMVNLPLGYSLNFTRALQQQKRLAYMR
jgi:hypothetical protein